VIHLQFTITGRTMRELNASAARIVRGFLGQEFTGRVPPLKLEVSPLVHDLDTEMPARWEAEVSVVLDDERSSDDG
jgi:hypothetical protein